MKTINEQYQMEIRKILQSVAYHGYDLVIAEIDCMKALDLALKQQAEKVTDEIADINFIKWYSGMEESKIRNAFKRYKSEAGLIKPAPINHYSSVITDKDLKDIDEAKAAVSIPDQKENKCELCGRPLREGEVNVCTDCFYR